MKLITPNEPHTCVLASVAMLLDMEYSEVRSKLYVPGFPFPPPWDALPLIPSMDVLCDWFLCERGKRLTPFVKNPVCTPDLACKPVPVWYNGDRKFTEQLRYGQGLIEGNTSKSAHMCAWDGERIFDCRGYIYASEFAEDYGFNLTRFWLCN